MNSSFSKKRHIFEVNQKLEQRFLREQAAYEDPTQTGFRADRGQLPKTQPAAQPAYEDPTQTGFRADRGQLPKTQPAAQPAVDNANPYYDEKTGKVVQIGTQRTDTLKATHQLPGDRSYQYGKDFNGNWFALRLSDKKWIDLKNIPSAIDKLNKGAVPIGTQAAKQNKSTQTATDTIAPNKQTSGGEAVKTDQQNNNTTTAQPPTIDSSKLFMTKNMIDKELSDFNTDEKYVAGLVSQLNPQEFDALIKSYGGLQGMTTKFFDAFKGVQDRVMLDQALRKFGYKFDFTNVRGNKGKINKILMITKT
jgi:hypothetical protein